MRVNFTINYQNSSCQVFWIFCINPLSKFIADRIIFGNKPKRLGSNVDKMFIYSLF